MLNLTLADVEASEAINARTITAFRIESLDDPALANLPPTSAFQTRAYVSAVLETIARAKAAEPVLIGVKSASGRLIALVPFTLERKFGILKLEGLDFQVVDCFAPSMAQDVDVPASVIWGAVLAALPRADAITLKKVPQRLHGRRHALSNHPELKPMGAAAHTVELTTDFDPARLNVSKDVRGKIKKLEAHGPIAFANISGEAEIAATMDLLFEYRLRRFAELDRPDPLANPAYRTFYERLASGPEPLAKIFTLSVGDEIVAVTYTLCHEGVLTLVIPTFSSDARWSRGSPGLVAIFKTLQWARETGFKTFDLSVGSSEFKSRFSAAQADLFEYHRAMSPLGLPLVLEAELRRQLRIKSQTNPKLRAMLERVRTRLARTSRPEQ